MLAHGELHAAEYGWDTSFEALVADIVAGYARAHDPAREAGWIAELDGRRVGCYRRITLWTNDILTAARRIYEAEGSTFVDQEPHRSFGRDLVGQNWTLDLG